MNLFVVVAYSLEDGSDDVGWMVAASEVGEAAALMEEQFQMLGSLKFQSFASYAFCPGIANTECHSGVITGPFYGKLFNMQECKLWTRQSQEDEWMCECP